MITAQERRKSVVREYIEAILIALLLALFIRTFVVQAFKIPSGSMKPTLLVGDHILVSKFVYGIKNPLNGATLVAMHKPERGDVVVFEYPVDPSKDFIKRVVGIEGDTVEVRDKKVFVNGQPVPDEHAVHVDSRVFPKEAQPRDNFGPTTVPKDSLLVMGDNRDESFDGRFWGFVALKAVKGKALVMYWSWDKDDFSVRWKRLGRLIH